MRVTGLDGREYSWKLKGADSSTPNKSAGHLRCRRLLASLYPFDVRLEEVGLPGSGGLTADFVIPSRNLLVEVQGVQHREYVGHFHRNRLGYLRSNRRDNRKREWAELNGLRLLELHDNATDEEWRESLLECERTPRKG